MVNFCCVKKCKNEAYPGSLFSFHKFPKDDRLNQEWKKLVSGHVTKCSVICSAHFKNDDYIPGTTRRLLKPESIPSVFPAMPVAPVNNEEDVRSGSPLSEDLISDTDSIFDTPVVATLKKQLDLEQKKSKNYRQQAYRFKKRAKYFENKTSKLRGIVKQLKNRNELYKKIISKLTETVKKANQG